MTPIAEAELKVKQAEDALKAAKDNLHAIIDAEDFPRSASKYWYLINCGDKWEVRWTMFGGGSKIDQRRRAAGNCYRTEEDAREVCDLRNTLTSKMEGWV